MLSDIGGIWRTIGGRRVFIKDGQDLATAMKESGKFLKNENSQYTYEENYALNKYFSPYSIVLNEKLRNKEKLTKEEQKIVNDLDNALKKTPNYNGPVVRTLEMINPKDFVSTLRVNEIYKTNQYLSFSDKEGYNDSANIKIYIENSKKGRDLRKINSIGESEVLFERNTEFKTLSIIEKHDIIYVIWEEC